MTELPRRRSRRPAIAWALIIGAAVTAVVLAMSMHPWQAGIALSLLAMFVGACLLEHET